MDNQQNTIQPNLYQFASTLIQKAGFDGLSEQFKRDLAEQIMAEAIDRLGMMVVAELPEEKLKEYGELIGQSQNPMADPKIAQFVAANVPEFARKFIDTLKSYQDEFVAEAQKSLKK